MRAIHLPNCYAPMNTRARVFAGTAHWAFVVISIAVLWYGFQIVFFSIYAMWAQTPRIVSNPAVLDEFAYGSTPAAVRWTLTTFAIYTGLLLASTRAFHGVGLRQLVGPIPTAWHEFWRVSLYLIPIYALLTVPSLFDPEAEQQFGVAEWLSLLPAILPLLFIQISAEELVFRGYLQSHIAALTQHPIIWMGLPSFLFGLIHYDPLTVPYSAWAYVAWATCLGLVCADLTARSGTLGPAFAVHFINNVGALVILAADDWLYGAALFVWPMHGLAWEPWIPFEALLLVTVWLSARLAIRR